MTAAAHSHPYDQLDPHMLLNAIEQLGLACDGRVLALNSYENRVFQIGLMDGSYVVAKFYRPGRWNEATLREEHAFCLTLAAADIPAVAPLPDANGETLHQFGGFQYAVYPRIAGRSPELDRPNDLRAIGRTLARMHAIGELRSFKHRPTLSVRALGADSVQFLLSSDLIPRELQREYRDAAEELLPLLENAWEACEPFRRIRIHGDFHPGNVLWTNDGAAILDFDDCRNGPAVQDLWMFLAGGRNDMLWQLHHLLGGYREFRSFPLSELPLIETLRSLRMVHYSAWLARRWDDPAFPRHFPWFGSFNYWREQIENLRDQLRCLNDPPLELIDFDE